MNFTKAYLPLTKEIRAIYISTLPTAIERHKDIMARYKRDIQAIKNGDYFRK